MVAARNNKSKKSNKEAGVVPLDSSFNLTDFEDFDLGELEEAQGQPVDLSLLPILEKAEKENVQTPSPSNNNTRRRERRVNPDDAPEVGATRYADLDGAEPASRSGGDLVTGSGSLTAPTLAEAAIASQGEADASFSPSPPTSPSPSGSEAAIGAPATPPQPATARLTSEGLSGAGFVASAPSQTETETETTPPVPPTETEAERRFATLGRVVRIPISLLVDNPYQYRREITPDSVADLVQDFTTRGLSKALQSIPKVKRWRKKESTAEAGPPNPAQASVQYVLSSGGHRRLTAWKLAFPGEAFPVYLEEGEVSEEELADGAIVENLLRRDPGEVEYALAFTALIDRFGYRQNQIATRYGLDATQISRYLSLLDLPPTLQEENARGRLPMRLGAHLARYKAVPQAAEYLYQLYQQQNYSVAAIENRGEMLLAESPLPSEVKDAAMALARPHKERSKGKDETSALAPQRVEPQPLSPAPAIETFAETKTETEAEAKTADESEVANYPASFIPEIPEPASGVDPTPAIIDAGQLVTVIAAQSLAQSHSEFEHENDEAEAEYLTENSEKPVPISTSLTPTIFEAELDLSLANNSAAPLPTGNVAQAQKQGEGQASTRTLLNKFEQDVNGLTVELVEETEGELEESGWTGRNSTWLGSEHGEGALELELALEEEEVEHLTQETTNNVVSSTVTSTDKANKGAIAVANDGGTLTPFYPERARLPQSSPHPTQERLPRLVSTRNRGGNPEYEEVLAEFLTRLGDAGAADPTRTANPSARSNKAALLVEFEEANPQAAFSWQMALVFAILQAEGSVVEQVIRENWKAISGGSTSAPRQQELEQPWLWTNTLWPEMTVRLLVEIVARHWQWEQQEIFEGIDQANTAFGWLLNQLKALAKQKAGLGY